MREWEQSPHPKHGWLRNRLRNSSDSEYSSLGCVTHKVDDPGSGGDSFIIGVGRSGSPLLP